MILIFSKNLQNQKNQSKKKKVLTLKNTIILLKRRQKVLNAFESGIFPKGKQGNGVWQMLKKLPVALAQAKVDNTSEKVINEIRQIIYSLYWAKKITKKVYTNIMNSIKL